LDPLDRLGVVAPVPVFARHSGPAAKVVDAACPGGSGTHPLIAAVKAGELSRHSIGDGRRWGP
jgi:hypothetical protein